MLPNLILKRKLDRDNFANLGAILGAVYDVAGNKVCVSLELPDLDNHKSISCIPSGKYKCLRDETGKHRYYKILNVEGREEIEIHPANKPSELRGCISFGKRWAFLHGAGFIQNSKPALDQLLIDYPEGFYLTIIDNFI